MRFNFYPILLAGLALLVSVQASIAQDQPHHARGAQAHAEVNWKTVSSPVARNQSNTLEFSNGTGDDFDRYLFRQDVAGGRSRFTVDITSGYCSSMQFTSQGLLANADELINTDALPATANIALRVFDVDHNSTYDDNGDGIPDPEVDHVYVNGRQVLLGGAPWELTSGNNTWSIPSINIPIDYLKFPQGEGQSAENLIEIDIDVKNVGWAIECSDIRISFQEPTCSATPIVLVNGFFGNKSTWDTFSGWLSRDGIAHEAVAVSGTGSMATNANYLHSQIERILRETGAKQVHIVAHSKGGLDTREYLRRYGHLNRVDKVVQLGTPNHGSVLAYGGAGIEMLVRFGLYYYGGILRLNPTVPAVYDLTPLHMNAYNYVAIGNGYRARNAFDKTKGNDIYSLVGTEEWSLTSWAFEGANDGVVPVANSTLP
ncbi:MAG: hypothetical protein AAFQ98_19045 [Bacteroidota bacterium]